MKTWYQSSSGIIGLGSLAGAVVLYGLALRDEAKRNALVLASGPADGSAESGAVLDAVEALEAADKYKLGAMWAAAMIGCVALGFSAFRSTR